MRMLDDVYGDDRDSFPLEQEARWRISRLEWEDEVPPEKEAAWYFVPDEDEDAWYFSAGSKTKTAPVKRSAPRR